MSDSEFDGSVEEASSTSGLKIVEDVPGTRLSLIWNGPRPGGWLRVVVPAAVIGLIVLFGSGPRGPWRLAWQQINAPGPRDLVGDGLLLLLACGSLFLLWICCRLLGQFVGYYRSLNFETTEQLLTIERRGWGLFFGRKSTVILFPQLQSFSLRAGRAGRGLLPLDLTIHYRDRGRQISRLSLPFRLLGCTRRAPALEFLLAIGRVVNAKGYLAGEDSPLAASWQLVLPYAVPESTADDEAEEVQDDNEVRDEDRDDEEDDEGDDDRDDDADRVDLLPIPVTADFGRSADDQPSRRAVFVDQGLAEQVDVARINEKLTFTQIEDWKPGTHVRFVRSRAPLLVFGFAAVFGAVVGGGLGGWPVYGFLSGITGQGVIWWPGALALSAAIGAAFLGFMAWNQFQEQSTDLDWSGQIILHKTGTVQRECQFDECQALMLSGIQRSRQTGSDESSSSTVEYGCRLDLISPTGDIPLLATDGWEPNQTTARNLLQPVGTSLAQSLGVSCTWQNVRATDLDTVRRVLTFPFWQWSVLSLLAAVAVIGIGRGVVDRQMRMDAGQAVRDLGGRVAWMNGFSMKEKSVYQGFYKVEFESDPAIDEHLTRLHPALLRVPELGIEITDCPLTDAGIRQLAGCAGLRVLTISNGRVTEDGISAIADCHELVYMNLYGNPLTDAGVATFSGLTRLRFLFLGGTRLTDQGLLKLQELKSLEYLQLTGSAITPAGVQQLRTARPDLDIDFFIPAK